jgi:hypothetical protein
VEKLNTLLTRDVLFLGKNRVMDFSLLLAIERTGNFERAIANSSMSASVSPYVSQAQLPDTDKSINNQDDLIDFLKHP